MWLSLPNLHCNACFERKPVKNLFHKNLIRKTKKIRDIPWGWDILFTQNLGRKITLTLSWTTKIKALLQYLSPQPAFTFSMSTMKIPEQWVKSVQSPQWRHQNDGNDVVLVFLLITLSKFLTLFCFYCCFWSSKSQLSLHWLCKVHCKLIGEIKLSYPFHTLFYLFFFTTSAIKIQYQKYIVKRQ